MAERRELGAIVEPLDRRAEAESGTPMLEAETRDPPATTPMETDRPTVIPPHRWWAEGELRGCQETAEAMVRTDTEEVGEGG